MRRQQKNIKKGSLIKNKYAFEDAFGITTSDVEYHSPRGSGNCTQYVWVLWNNGEHCLFKVQMLEVINESR